MKHQTDNTQHTERANNADSFEIFELKILIAVDKIKGKKKLADINTIHNFKVQADAKVLIKAPSKIL